MSRRRIRRGKKLWRDDRDNIIPFDPAQSGRRHWTGSGEVIPFRRD
jgi:hypothetical protein